MGNEAAGFIPALPKYEHWRQASAANPKMNDGDNMYKLFKCRNLIVVLTFVATLALITTVAQAQLVNELEANIPFTFSVDNTRLPAGEYCLRPVGDLGDNVLEIESVNKNISVLITPESSQPSRLPNNSELTFDKIGNHYFLREIEVRDGQFGYTLMQSKSEAKLAKGTAKLEKHTLTIKDHKTRVSLP